MENSRSSGSPGALAQFLPGGGGRGGMLGKIGAPRVGFRLEGEQPPEMRALRLFQRPADDFRHEFHVAARDRAVVRELQRQARLRAQIQPEPRERIAHGMQVGLGFDPVDWVAVPPGLGHVDVDGHLPQAAVDHELL